LYDEFMQRLRSIDYLAAMLSIVCVVDLVSVREAAARNDVMIIEGQAAPLGPPTSGENSLVKKSTPGQAPSTTAGQSSSATVLRDVPSISGRYSVGGTTLMPYLGAGFGSGYASELDRSLNSPLSTSTDTGLRSQFGQSLTPNELQMGIRIPF
jgi:hypothetical protein